jgi:16S rRNA A1518/A1519 N6-dimethyltransferase RsmA/KsgA/DIM1 with predicted DNA glycosylase/AP lyase activity
MFLFQNLKWIQQLFVSLKKKMLRNTLKGWDIHPDLQEQINFTRRPETLTIEEFVTLV